MNMMKYCPECYKELPPNSAVCPYCGYEFTDSWELGDGGEVDCDKCGNVFTFTTDITIYYFSERDCKLNNRRHVWQTCEQVRGGTMQECKNCDQLRMVRRSG